MRSLLTKARQVLAAVFAFNEFRMIPANQSYFERKLNIVNSLACLLNNKEGSTYVFFMLFVRLDLYF